MKYMYSLAAALIPTACDALHFEVNEYEIVLGWSQRI